MNVKCMIFYTLIMLVPDIKMYKYPVISNLTAFKYLIFCINYLEKMDFCKCKLFVKILSCALSFLQIVR